MGGTGGVMTETDVKASHGVPSVVTIMVPMTILDTRISIVLIASMATVRRKNVTLTRPLHSYPLYNPQLCWSLILEV